MFSNNVAHVVIDNIIGRGGFLVANGIGKYLGALCPNGKGKKKSLKGILDRMGNKLAGWKAHCLSMTGRITLTQLVLGSMDSFAMQHTKVPLTVICKEMETMHRSFVWGDGPNVRKPRLISWDVICLPRDLGGLGLRKYEVMNEAFLLKLAYGVFNKPNDLWVRVLKGKYY